MCAKTSKYQEGFLCKKSSLISCDTFHCILLKYLYKKHFLKYQEQKSDKTALNAKLSYSTVQNFASSLPCSFLRSQDPVKLGTMKLSCVMKKFLNMNVDDKKFDS